MEIALEALHALMLSDPGREYALHKSLVPTLLCVHDLYPSGNFLHIIARIFYVLGWMVPEGQRQLEMAGVADKIVAGILLYHSEIFAADLLAVASCITMNRLPGEVWLPVLPFIRNILLQGMNDPVATRRTMWALRNFSASEQFALILCDNGILALLVDTLDRYLNVPGVITLVLESLRWLCVAPRTPYALVELLIHQVIASIGCKTEMQYSFQYRKCFD